MSAGRSSTAAPATAASSTTAGTIPSTFANLGTIPGARDRRAHRRPAEPGRAGRAQPARRRVRPRAHLRAGVPARGRRLLGRHEVPLSRHRRGAEIIHFTHWLGALITSSDVIGTIDTPVRAVINRAASLLDTPLSLLALVVTHDGVAGVFCGERAATRGGRRPRSRRGATSSGSTSRSTACSSVMPAMYDDLWTAAKGVYKTRAGGRRRRRGHHLRAARARSRATCTAALIDEIGYHCRDYFLAQWDRFGGYPGGILAHSTHVKGLGTFDAGARRRDAAHHGHARHRHSAASAASASTSAIANPAERRSRRVVDRHAASAAALHRCRAPARCLFARRDQPPGRASRRYRTNR